MKTPNKAIHLLLNFRVFSIIFKMAKESKSSITDMNFIIRKLLYSVSVR